MKKHFEKTARELTASFGVKPTESTHGYRSILSALNDAYNAGRADAKKELVVSAIQNMDELLNRLDGKEGETK